MTKARERTGRPGTERETAADRHAAGAAGSTNAAGGAGLSNADGSSAHASSSAAGRELWAQERPPRRGAREMLRYWWRQLTSMRTALILLFLLALASVPGSLLPQQGLSPSKVRDYLTEYPTLGPWLLRLGFFDVFASPWYAAIYLLLFVSLIGCLGPRIAVYLRSLRAQPPNAPRHLRRIGEYDAAEVTGDAEAVLDRGERLLRAKRWRVVRRDSPYGPTLAAEKGYLQEAGNLVFHLSLLALLLALAVGRLTGYEGSRIAIEGEGFCNTAMSYDTLRAGPLVDASGMTPLCLELESFQTVYEQDLTPARFITDITYTRDLDDDGQDYTIESNEPLRVDGIRVYVTGHGYAPVFTVTLPDGTARTESAPFLPSDQATLGSEGAIKIDTGEAEKQLALQGFLAPTAVDSGDGIIRSSDPRLLNPQVALRVFQGYTGLDTGAPQSVYSIDQEVIDQGLLDQVASVNLTPGQSVTLPDGTSIAFEGVATWAAFQVSRDAGQVWVLISAIVLLGSLMVSLSMRRRRLWVRIMADGGAAGAGTGGRRVEVGGLAHSGHQAFSAEFTALAARILDRAPEPDEDVRRRESDERITP